MHVRLLALSLAPLFATSLAQAQAPGDMMMPPPVAAPPQAAAACGFRHAESVMARRWAIGLSFGAMTIAPQAQPDDETAFAIGELALRFRATPHWELELAVSGGRERTPDGEEGELEVGSAAIAARYRFLPEHRWNWFLMGGLGGAAVTRHDPTDEERDDATQPLAMLGIGTELRLGHFAFQAEARAIGIGDKHHEEVVLDVDTRTTSPMAVTAAPATNQARGGGVVTLGVSYYF